MPKIISKSKNDLQVVLLLSCFVEHSVIDCLYLHTRCTKYKYKLVR